MSEPEIESADERVRALYEDAESKAADAFEDLVAKPSFGVLLARSAENVAAVTKISSDLADLVLRNLRVAGRADVTRLARQINRIEDKLERVLQEIEELRDELKRGPAAGAPTEAEVDGGAGLSHEPPNGSVGAANGASSKSGSKSGSKAGSKAGSKHISEVP
jgi:DNA repair exonuclease SbcCD ATPase subunit